MEWGMPLPGDVSKDDCVCVWGARAIYRMDIPGLPLSFSTGLKPPRKKKKAKVELVVDIDIVPDRCGFEGERSEEFFKWLSGSGIPALRELCRLYRLEPSSRNEVRLDKGAFGISATPNASYGYLYIVAWQRKKKEGPCENPSEK